MLSRGFIQDHREGFLEMGANHQCIISISVGSFHLKRGYFKLTRDIFQAGYRKKQEKERRVWWDTQSLWALRRESYC